MVYETVEESGGGNNNAACFVNVNFELETFDPERIALEKVFRDAPKPAVVMKKKEDDDKMGNIGEDPQRKVKKCKKEETKSEIVSSEPKNKGEKVTPSKLDQGLDGLQCSIRAMNARMRILLEFLRRVDKGEVPRDDGLLKSVNGLIQQLPLVCAALEEGVASSLSDNVGNSRTPLRELENEYNDTMLLSYLAVVAKTAKSVHTYTEKYRSACEGSRRG
jgi:COP9 signalosome complex subunit 6